MPMASARQTSRHPSVALHPDVAPLKLRISAATAPHPSAKSAERIRSVRITTNPNRIADTLTKLSSASRSALTSG
jgi:hypothetical protein